MNVGVISAVRHSNTVNVSYATDNFRETRADLLCTSDIKTPVLSW
jgi:hypothetical protein